MLTKGSLSKDAGPLLVSLERIHNRLEAKVDDLYSSLNVQDAFPELHGIDFEFIQTLLMARDLKINIRKRAIGSFFEWDKLDQAVGGREEALGTFISSSYHIFIKSMGTKHHQHTRKAIAKRRPAIMTAIRKFNSYCEVVTNTATPGASLSSDAIQPP
jgi:hypothetical protein